MSTDEQSDDDAILAPRVSTTPRAHNVNQFMGDGDLTRNSFGSEFDRSSLWMEQYGGERNLFSALGYVTNPRYEHYRARYERTDTAQALIDKIPQKAWSRPEVIDTGVESGTSDFEEKANEFLKGEYTEENPIEVMERATRMERLGKYSLIFLGLNDDNATPSETEDEDNESSGVNLLSNEVDESSLQDQDAGEAIVYIRPYDEGRADPEEINWETADPTSERFGKPISYNIDFGDHQPTGRVHHSRVIHVVGNVFDNEFISPSILKSSINRIDDIEKILGGSAEAYWRSAYSPMIVSPPEIQGQMTEFSDSGEELHKQINRYINNFSREIFTAADVKLMNPDAENPLEFLETQYRDLAVGHNIPQSILMGNETGERATEEDRRMFNERVSDFREEYCEPAVVNKFIAMLINLNVFPEPQGWFQLNWPPVDEKTEKEEANIRQTLSDALNSGTGGRPMTVVTPEEYREKILDWEPERGSEVDMEGIESVESEELQLNEDDERVQEQFGRLNQQYEEEDKVNTPDGRGFVVDVLTEGFDVEGEEKVEASEESPTYVVVIEDENKAFGYYKADDLEKEDWDSGVEDPVSDLKEVGDEDRENILKVRIEEVLAAVRKNQEGHFTWPESWRKSDKPARLIAMDAWLSMGASGVSSCIRTMRGEVASPERFCADFADRLYQWEYWRGDSWAPGD